MSEPQVDELKVQEAVSVPSSSVENSSGRKIYRARRVGTSVLDSFSTAPIPGFVSDQNRQDERTSPTAENNSSTRQLKRRADVHR